MTSDPALETDFRLSFEQRQRAQSIEEWCCEHPDKAAHLIIGYAALASAPADGYKLVPVEPTEEMFWATKEHCKWWHGEMGGRMPPSYEFCAEIYRAMIAAAPQRGGE